MLVRAARENLLWRSQGQQRWCVSRCSHVHCLLPHAGMFAAFLCPCVSRQDVLNYFAQLPPWTIATARQYTHDAEPHTHSTEDHSSRPSHTCVPPDTFQTCRNKDGSRLLSVAVGSFSDQSVRDLLLIFPTSTWKACSWVESWWQRVLINSSAVRNLELNDVIRFISFNYCNADVVDCSSAWDLGVWKAHKWLLPSGSYVMCDHFSVVAGRLLLQPCEAGYTLPFCPTSTHFYSGKTHIVVCYWLEMFLNSSQ